MLERTQLPGPCAFPFQSGPVCKTCKLASKGGLLACSRLVSESEAMRLMLRRVPAIAATDASIVILGESGSGKEVLARALHANGPRASAPFVAVNVAALPADLLESELFGHVKGAFTGATAAKTGLFHEAHGGTLFLDEIAEMPLPLQAKLLRAVQDGEVRRVGETRPFRVNARIICATHQDLTRCVAERRFREDLYYRLKVFTLVVPPLRARRDDVLPLARLFLSQEKHATGRFTARAEQALCAYAWPGNVRELQNACKHGAALSPAHDVDLEHLPLELSDPAAVRSGRHADDEALRPLAEVEREHVLRVLEAVGGRQGEAARILGIGRTSLWRKLHDYGLREGAP